MSTFLANVPIWVYPLFVLLLALGLRASRRRQVPLLVVYAMPLLGILTLNNIISLGAPAWIWLIAAVVYALGVALGLSLQKRWLITRLPRHVELHGEWVTLAAMMIIFAAGFVKGTLSALLPDVVGSALFAVLFIAVVCLPAGQFLGRAIASARAPLSPGA